jgi:cellobiose-specific phosphotransferase system component IIC
MALSTITLILMALMIITWLVDLFTSRQPVSAFDGAAQRRWNRLSLEIGMVTVLALLSFFLWLIHL